MMLKILEYFIVFITMIIKAKIRKYIVTITVWRTSWGKKITVKNNYFFMELCTTHNNSTESYFEM